MKFKCPRVALQESLSRVAAIAPKRHARAILSNIRIEVLNGQLLASATDSEVYLSNAVADAICESEGAAVVGSELLDICRNSDSNEISVELNEDKAAISAGQGSWTLQVHDAAEFPAFPDVDAEPITVEMAPFAKAIRRTIFACDEASTRFALGGAHIEREQSELTLAATDSRRLAVHSLPCAGDGEIPSNSTIPAKALKAIGSLQGKTCQLRISRGGLVFSCENARLYCSMLEGRFPKYRDVIPKKHNARLGSVCGPFFSAIRQSMIVLNAESRGVDFAALDGNLQLSSQGNEVGNSKIDLPVSLDDNFAVTLDPKLVRDLFVTVEGTESMEMDVVDSNTAVIFRADGTTYVVMPLSRDN